MISYIINYMILNVNLIQCPSFLVTTVKLLLFQTVRRVGHLAYLVLTFVNLFYTLVFQVEKWFSSVHDLKHLRISIFRFQSDLLLTLIY